MCFAPDASITSRSNPKGDTARRRHLRECGHEIFIHRITFAVDTLLLRHRQIETHALLRDVGEFTNSVAKFDAAGIKLAPLGNLVVAWL